MLCALAAQPLREVGTWMLPKENVRLEPRNLKKRQHVSKPCLICIVLPNRGLLHLASNQMPQSSTGTC